MDAMQLRVRQRRPQPAQIQVARVGQGDGATGQHGRGHPGLAQAAFGDRDEVQTALRGARPATASVFLPIASTSTRSSGISPPK